MQNRIFHKLRSELKLRPGHAHSVVDFVRSNTIKQTNWSVCVNHAVFSQANWSESWRLAPDGIRFSYVCFVNPVDIMSNAMTICQDVPESRASTSTKSSTRQAKSLIFKVSTLGLEPRGIGQGKHSFASDGGNPQNFWFGTSDSHGQQIFQHGQHLVRLGTPEIQPVQNLTWPNWQKRSVGG